jgi:hypothetical protein
VDEETGEFIDGAALKTLLHNIADRLPRRQSVRQMYDHYPNAA